jgi:hypothetical protein
MQRRAPSCIHLNRNISNASDRQAGSRLGIDDFGGNRSGDSPSKCPALGQTRADRVTRDSRLPQVAGFPIRRGATDDRVNEARDIHPSLIGLSLIFPGDPGDIEGTTMPRGLIREALQILSAWFVGLDTPIDRDIDDTTLMRSEIDSMGFYEFSHAWTRGQAVSHPRLGQDRGRA